MERKWNQSARNQLRKTSVLRVQTNSDLRRASRNKCFNLHRQCKYKAWCLFMTSHLQLSRHTKPRKSQGYLAADSTKKKPTNCKIYCMHGGIEEPKG